MPEPFNWVFAPRKTAPDCSGDYFISELSMHPSSSSHQPASDWSADDAPEMFFRYRVTSPAGFDHVNEAMARATGYRMAEFYSNPDLLTMMTVAEDRPRLASFLNAAQQTGQPAVVRWSRKGGTVLTVELRARQIQNEDGQVIALDVVARDVTVAGGTAADVRVPENHLHSLLDFSMDGLGILRSQRSHTGQVNDFVWEYANKTATDLIGDEGVELIGESVSHAFSEESMTHIFDYLRRVWIAKDPAPIVAKLRDRDAAVLLSAAATDDGVIVRLDRTDAGESSAASLRFVDLAERIMNPQFSLLDRLTGVCEGLIDFGADFALAVAIPSPRREPVVTIRTRNESVDPAVLENFADRWKRLRTGPAPAKRRKSDVETSDVRVSSRNRSESTADIDIGTLDLETAITTSSLHTVPLGGVNGEIGAVIFGTERSHPPLSQDQLRHSQLLIQPVMNAIEIAQLRDQASSSAGTREQFMSTVAHEIKTPLTGIRGYAQLLGRYISREDPDIIRARKAVKGLQTQIDRFITLADDLLDAARIHHGRLDLRLVRSDLSAIARDAVERTNTMFGTTGHAVEIDVPGPLLGVWDPARIDQVLFILLSNAVQYSRGGGIRLAAWQKSDRVYVSVTDHGVGIEKADVERLFEPFARGQAASGLIEGSGLGLYLAREIVQHHGGEIDIQSRPKVGTTVTVELPIETTPAELSSDVSEDDQVRGQPGRSQAGSGY